MMSSANIPQAIFKKKSQLLLFLRYAWVCRQSTDAIRNGSNGYTRADISSAQIRRGGKKHNEANAAAEFPQLFNFAGSIFGDIVISVSIKNMWILHQQRFCSNSFKPYTIHPDVHLLQEHTP
jgi:hypothetical protein